MAQKRVRMKTRMALPKRVLAFRGDLAKKRSPEMTETIAHADSGTHRHAEIALAYAETGSF